MHVRPRDANPIAEPSPATNPEPMAMEEDAPPKKTSEQPPSTIPAMFQAVPLSEREGGPVKGGLKYGAWDEQELEGLWGLQAKYAGKSEWAQKVADAWPLPQNRDRNQVHSKWKWLER